MTSDAANPQRPPCLNSMNFHQLREALRTDAEVVFGLSPESLRDICTKNGMSAELLEKCFEDICATGMKHEKASESAQLRPGFASPLMVADWATNMASIARLCQHLDPFPYVAGEIGYEQELVRSRENVERVERRRLEAVASTSRRQPAEQAVPAITQDMSPPIYLPKLLAGRLQLPNLVMRSPVVCIGPRRKARRSYPASAPLRIADVSGYKYGEVVVSYSGEELRVDDIETWAYVLRLAAPLPLGGPVHFGARELALALGRGAGGTAYAAAREQISRLQGGVLHIRTANQAIREQFANMFPDDPIIKNKRPGPIEVSFNLLGQASTDGSRWSIVVPRAVRVAFGKGVSSWFSQSKYLALDGDTSRRLMLFYASHARPWPFTASELGQYIGSSTQRHNDLTTQLSKAHDELQRAGIIASWELRKSGHRTVDSSYSVVFLEKALGPIE
jgi:hypothetical protein